MAQNFNSKDVFDTVEQAGLNGVSTTPVTTGLSNAVGDSLAATQTSSYNVSPQGITPAANPMPNNVVNSQKPSKKPIIYSAITSGLLFAIIGLGLGWFLQESRVSDLQKQNKVLVSTKDNLTQDKQGLQEELNQLSPKSTSNEAGDEGGASETTDQTGSDNESGQKEVLIIASDKQVTYIKSDSSNRLEFGRVNSSSTSDSYSKYGINSRTVTNYLRDQKADNLCNESISFGYFDFFKSKERIADNQPYTYSSIEELNKQADDDNSTVRRLSDDLYVRYISPQSACYYELFEEKDNQVVESKVTELVPGLEANPADDARNVLSSFEVVE